ncbi:MAG: EF-hand domain-containing protein [Myxococcaceae bacterium]|nr:EF-hand domain-containing protein [Myxococcaceae bacterium]
MLIRVEAEHRANARIARLVVAGRTLWGVVHHGEELESSGASSAQQGLRAALTGLILGDATQFESLLKSVEKVIFDQAIPTNVGIRVGSSPARTDSSTAEEIPESLRATPEDMAHAARKRRVLESGDLALILDALCRKLGQGLSMNSSSGPIAQSEERLKDSDDEALVDIAQFDLVDTARLAKLCRTKGNTILRRLGQQIEKAQKATEVPTGVIAQAAAVLGVLRQLRRADLKDPWRAAGETLIDDAKLGQFVWDSMPALVCRSDSLLKRAVSGAGEFEEATALRELLGWLAWDCDVVPGRCTGTKETTPKEDAEWWSHFTDVAVEISRDGAARERLESNLPFTPRPERSAEKWLKAFEDWGVMLAASPDRFRSGKLEPGDLVFILARNRVGYVLDHHEGKVAVRDFDKDSGKLTFDEKFVKPVDLSVGGAIAVSGHRG